VDETGQPGSEPVRVGDEASATLAAGWQPSSNGASRDTNGSRADGLRLRTTDTPWSSAGAALEPDMEPASTGWRRSLTSGLRGRAEVRSRYADLLAPISPALPPTGTRPGEVPASAPPYPYEGDLDAPRGWASPTPARPPDPPAEPQSQPPYPQFRPSPALTDNTFDDLPALAQAAAASQAAQAAAQAASAVQAARAAEAAAEARAVVEDHAAVEAAYRAAQGGTEIAEEPPEPPARYRATAALPDPRVPGTRPAEFRAPSHPPGEARPPLTLPAVPRSPAQSPPPEAVHRPPADPLNRPPAGGEPQSRTAVDPHNRAAVDPHNRAAVQPPAVPSADATPPGRPAEPVPPAARGPVDLLRPFTAASPVSTPPPGSRGSLGPLPPPGLRPPVEPPPGASSPLPQRIPAPPDVPEVPEDEPDDQFIDHGERLRSGIAPPELARIATHLRYDEDFEEQTTERPDGFDVDTVLSAVRLVPGVRDAQLRPNPGGVHTLRLDLADGADPGQVSRLVARLLKQKMGLAAEPRRQNPNRPTGPPPGLRDPGLPKDAVIPGVPPAPRPAEPQHSSGRLEPARSDPGHPDERSRHRVTPLRTREGHAEGEGRRAARPGAQPRVVINQVQVSTLGLDATVEVRLTSNGAPAYGVASGPAVDGYVLRLAAVAATNAIDQLLSSAEGGERQGRSFVEHATVVPFGSCEVAVVVLLLVYGGTIEQLTGSALVSGDPRQAIVRATMAAVNRRLDALLG